ncbi:MAG TPA: (2Fe-2S) ferredoxin domain-containing protein [Candidatus Tidjanibacter gallistercoris]|nr:(2Fe-2S) ferredoxin domain-containing protein [Candidatus Tidjanibacter gallistercoris]
MGKRRISICLGSSCFARGNNANIAVVKRFLAENGLQAEVTFTGQLCENMCSRGPVICIDDQVYEEVNLSLLHKILEEEFKC